MAGYKCPEGCTCKRHIGPWTGKKRPDYPAYKHGHTWGDPVTGESRCTPTYKSWQAMKHRSRYHPDYIARGFTVCAGWLDFRNFLADMGERPDGMTIDRRDNDLGYWCGHCTECLELGHPANGQWATKIEQAGNRRPKTKRKHLGNLPEHNRFDVTYLYAGMNVHWKACLASADSET